MREFLDKEVDFETIKKILEAGNAAPTWNHNRNWSYIILQTNEEKAYAFEHAKKIADKFDADKYLNTPRPYPTTLAQKMYALRYAKTIYHIKRCTICNQIKGAEWRV